MERSAVSDVRLGKSLRKCRRSIRPVYSQLDLAACVLSDPVCQGIFPNPIQGPADLVPVIEELEAHGNWTLPRHLLAPFLQASVNCFTPSCRQDLLTEFVANIVTTIIPAVDPTYTTFIDRYLPKSGNHSENEDEGEEDDDDNRND
jgi:hypothetical protein